VITRRRVLLAGLVVALGGVNALIAQKEHLRATGTPMLLELAPVDPRSLIQGDYMRLDYALANEVRQRDHAPRDGHLVVRVDARRIATFVRLDDGRRPLAPGEHLLRYRTREGEVRVGSGAFFFQEGHAGRYEGAKYGEVRVAASGNNLLIGLRDERLRPIR
jgi:uncharacterized membrane-anchored protein